MLTTYNEKEEKYELVQEQDTSITYTYTDYLQWKFTERPELIRGRIFRTKTPNSLVQQTYARIVTRLYTALSNMPCNVFHAPFDVRLPVKATPADKDITTVVQPDICAIYNGAFVDGHGCYGIPDLMIEILSPGSSVEDMHTKFELYQDAEVPEYWLVNPASKNVTFYSLSEAGKYNEGKTFSGQEIIRSKSIERFIIQAADIFR